MQANVIDVEGEPVEITIDNVNNAIKRLKAHRASGPRNIRAKMIKCGSGKLKEMITTLFNKFINGKNGKLGT